LRAARPLDPTVISLCDTINGLRDVLAGSLHGSEGWWRRG
jgi:hypothetical protein